MIWERKRMICAIHCYYLVETFVHPLHGYLSLYNPVKRERKKKERRARSGEGGRHEKRRKRRGGKGERGKIPERALVFIFVIYIIHHIY
jgi:hypothetical protein